MTVNKTGNKNLTYLTKSRKYGLRKEVDMGNFSTGMLLGAMLGIGLAMMDKKDIKKAKKMMRNMHF